MKHEVKKYSKKIIRNNEQVNFTCLKTSQEGVFIIILREHALANLNISLKSYMIHILYSPFKITCITEKHQGEHR